MKKSILLFLIFSFTGHLFAQTIRTVKITGSDYPTITAALTNFTSGTIWVAAGTYAEAELIIPTGVTVIGGFPTTAKTITDRVYPGVAKSDQLSILDGSYTHRVATVNGNTTSQGVLDGFLIRKGYANANGTNGGGVLIAGGTVQNCILTNNIASTLPPTSSNIPGTYVASIGDIYCTDKTIVEPTYSVNSSGVYVAILPSGYSYSSSTGLITTPSNSTKTPLGIVFYVNPSATTANFLVVGKLSTSTLYWSNPEYDTKNLNDINDLPTAQDDMAGATNTQLLNTYIATIPSNKTVSYPALQYVNTYPTQSTNVTWYVPAGGEMLKLWSVYPQVDACATLLAWETSTWFPSNSAGYWTSTEGGQNYEWYLDARSYPASPATLSKAADKTSPNFVFPVASINY